MLNSESQTTTTLITRERGLLRRALAAIRGRLFLPREPASRAYRYLARSLERDFKTSGSGVCLSFCAPDDDTIAADAVLMLAFCLQSELDSRVLIIDARFKSSAGGVSERLGIDNCAGFTDVLCPGTDTSTVFLQPTKLPRVCVLAAGNALESSGQPADFERLKILLRRIRMRFNYVLVQVGSVLTDTRSLRTAAEADAVFLVAEENRTHMKLLDDCRGVLCGLGVADVRVVITGAKP